MRLVCNGCNSYLTIYKINIKDNKNVHVPKMQQNTSKIFLEFGL